MYFWNTQQHNSPFIQKDENTSIIILRDTAPAIGDSRLLLMENGTIITATSKDSFFQFSSGEFTLKTTNPTIPAHWISVASSKESADTIITATADAFSGSLFVHAVDSTTGSAVRLFEKKPIQGEFIIDPVIQKIDTGYIMSYTSVRGTVNNNDSMQPNGSYTVYTMRSTTGNDWDPAGEIMQRTRNIEDGRLVHHPQKEELYFFFEEETVDQKKSAQKVIVSYDFGKSWKNEKILLEPAADQELGSIFFHEGTNTWEMLYSSDIGPGSGSYETARIYRASFNSNFDVLKKNIDENIPFGSALLYDYIKKESHEYYLFAHHYLGSNKALVLLQRDSVDQ